MPEFPDSEAQGREGMFAVGRVLSKMKWIFREQPVPDTGIDGHIETRDENTKPTGRLIGCQVKSGANYFREETTQGFIYRGNPEHLAYWRGHSLPVIVILCDEQTDNFIRKLLSGFQLCGIETFESCGIFMCRSNRPCDA